MTCWYSIADLHFRQLHVCCNPASRAPAPAATHHDRTSSRPHPSTHARCRYRTGPSSRRRRWSRSGRSLTTSRRGAPFHSAAQLLRGDALCGVCAPVGAALLLAGDEGFFVIFRCPDLRSPFREWFAEGQHAEDAVSLDVRFGFSCG